MSQERKILTPDEMETLIAGLSMKDLQTSMDNFIEETTWTKPLPEDITDPDPTGTGDVYADEPDEDEPVSLIKKRNTIFQV